MAKETLQQLNEDSKPGLDELSRVANDVFSAASGTAEGTGRDPGLLITTEDVRKIRRYVDTGLALPTDPQQIKHLLGNYESDIVGLKSEDIVRLYLSIRAHAGSWSVLENDMRAVGSDLHVFSGNLIGTVQETVDYIKSLDAWRTLDLEGLTPEQVEQMPPASLEEGDRKKMPGLLALVDELRLHIKAHSASTLRVRDGVAVFKGTLREGIAPEVALKIRLTDAAQSSGDIAGLKDEINTLNERIEQKIREYEQYSKYKWVGWWWGPIGGAISLSIYGPKAAAVLKEKNALVEQKSALQNQLRQLDTFIADMHTLETSLQDLKIRIDGAISSTGELESLWVLLKDLVDSSARHLETLDNVRLLVIFVSRFKNMISHWQDIQKHALDLLTAFNKALSESRR
ncbi:alpha-xenorhabdolysin family binary toxin subunit A [Pseudomonas ovata]|uniref:alpha-xenorhabdolysin family binary toxin subunit A n=1 Tax=Pseudomonas ovata TaxID=1839709 RepID=UPI000D685A27|nr:alpha-xenorhabdolysin family binary toxin subunit A [Pseudomonas ovata]